MSSTEGSPSHPLLAETPGELISQDGVLGTEPGDLVLRVVETLPQRSLQSLFARMEPAGPLVGRSGGG